MRVRWSRPWWILIDITLLRPPGLAMGGAESSLYLIWRKTAVKQIKTTIRFKQLLSGNTLMDIVITRPTSELLGSQRHDAIKKTQKLGLNAELPIHTQDGSCLYYFMFALICSFPCFFKLFYDSIILITHLCKWLHTLPETEAQIEIDRWNFFCHFLLSETWKTLFSPSQSNPRMVRVLERGCCLFPTKSSPSRRIRTCPVIWATWSGALLHQDSLEF